EDASHAIGGKYQGEFIGNCRYSDITVFSYHPVKIITTAEGGMALTNSAELADKMAFLRSHGITRDPTLMTREADGPWYYQQIDLGFNYRMTDVEGAIGSKQMDQAAEITDRRRANAAAHTDALASIDGLHAPVETDKATHVYHLYPVRIDPSAFITPEGGESIRDLFCRALNAEGIGTAIHYPRSLTRQPLFDKPGVDHQPVADSLADLLFCVPVHQHLSEQQIAKVGQALKKVADGLRR
ncbi:MAG: DegT/DnrJ/EryC1/StrS family aminotransferase, partial [Phycisphaerales bacterium]